MARITIITDTDSSLSRQMAVEYGILQVPISISFGAQTYDTGIDIDDEKLMERVRQENKLPTTAAPTPGKYAEAYQQAFEAGADEVICLCVSSKVSASYQAAKTACDLLPGKTITVIDSNSVCIGQGFMALAAARAAQAGATRAQIIAQAESVRDRTHLFAALSTLKHLAMSGRVGYLAAGMASLFDVKPILTIKDGKLEMLERARTQKRAWARLLELTTIAAANKPVEQMAILHVTALAEAKQFQKQLASAIACPPGTFFAELTPGLSVHTGGGVVGIGFVTGA